MDNMHVSSDIFIRIFGYKVMHFYVLLCQYIYNVDEIDYVLILVYIAAFFKF